MPGHACLWHPSLCALHDYWLDWPAALGSGVSLAAACAWRSSGGAGGRWCSCSMHYWILPPHSSSVERTRAWASSWRMRDTMCACPLALTAVTSTTTKLRLRFGGEGDHHGDGILVSPCLTQAVRILNRECRCGWAIAAATPTAGATSPWRPPPTPSGPSPGARGLLCLAAAARRAASAAGGCRQPRSQHHGARQQRLAAAPHLPQ